MKILLRVVLLFSMTLLVMSRAEAQQTAVGYVSGGTATMTINEAMIASEFQSEIGGGITCLDVEIVQNTTTGVWFLAFATSGATGFAELEEISGSLYLGTEHVRWCNGCYFPWGCMPAGTICIKVSCNNPSVTCQNLTPHTLASPNKIGTFY